jgi:hypothetical protein
MSEEITNGELHRTLLQMKRDTGEQLAAVLIELLQVGYVLGAFIFGAGFVWLLNLWGKL